METKTLNKKGTGKITGIVIALLLFASVITGMSLFMGDLTNNYNTNIPDKYTQLYGEINGSLTETQGLVRTVQNKTETSEGLQLEDETDFSLTDIGKSAWSAVKLIFGVIPITAGIITSFFSILGAGAWFGYVLVTIVIVIIVMLVLGAWFRRDL
jgi:hypothetical protein